MMLFSLEEMPALSDDAWLLDNAHPLLLDDAHRLGVVMVPTLLQDMHGDAHPVDDINLLGDRQPFLIM
jgi:hypothetical protein